MLSYFLILKTMQKLILTFIFLIVAQFSFGQNVNIPDPLFKNALLTYSPTIDLNEDGEIQVSEAENITFLELTNKSISNTTGLEAFINLEELNMSYNDLIAIDISALSALEFLKLDHNDIAAIDFSENLSLKEFWANFNEFITLDFSNHTNLEFVQVSYSFNLVGVNVQGCTNLERLFLGDSGLQEIDITTNPNLTIIQAINTPITEIDVSQNPLLDRILLSETAITSIDVSQNQLLEYLLLNETLVTEIDFSNNTNMFSFQASDCPNLQFVNAKNDANFWIAFFTAEHNPLLEYICVDNVSYAVANFDVTEPTLFTEDCENFTIDYNIIRGTLTFDEVGDGCNENDITVPNYMIRSQESENTFASFTNPDGAYVTIVGLGAYTTEVVGLPQPFIVTPENSVSNFTNYGNTVFQNFCTSIDADFTDVSISMCALGGARPGFDAEYAIYIENSGLTTVSGSVVIEFDETMQTYLFASREPSVTTVNTLTFNYEGLEPFQYEFITINMNTFQPPIVNSDDILNFSAVINPIEGDDNVDNNTHEFSQVVVNSYDPNDKLVAQGEEIHIDDISEDLFYTIRFQNTGTASAVNVRITDQLSTNLDWNTLKSVSASHDFDMQVTNGNNIEFIFEDIFLPAQQDDDIGSNGYVVFRIKPKSDLVVGDIIDGQAQIFFDFNAPIITNVVSTQVVEDNLSVNDYNLELALELFPNPAKSVLNIKSNQSISDYKIVDIKGRVIQSQNTIQKSEFSIDLRELSNGIYFVNLQTEFGLLVKKIIIRN
jgi:uncharacterized repeat protein (TIGR01451 family)